METGGIPLITRDGIYLKLGDPTTGSGFGVRNWNTVPIVSSVCVKQPGCLGRRIDEGVPGNGGAGAISEGR